MKKNVPLSDPFDETFDKLDPFYQSQLHQIYKGISEYYTKNIKSSHNLIINWLFLLNTGSIVGVISLISSDRTNLKTLYPSLFLWCLGIICIFISVKLHRHKSTVNARRLDMFFEELQDLKISGSTFLKKIYEETWWRIFLPYNFENLSILFWIIGGGSVFYYIKI
ncbi:Uncharacterised protein [Legionella donaldsonii]|uniref:Uncharacterized protein n=1 Tax=Legionella donaldsonii TaxID=45060 RepID=A0A378KNJ9_9GAMM|nr:hypothetical protein [Legionella donaldsonii]STX84922.1 Uncharacterised protein [Legionella donaldsonii]